MILTLFGDKVYNTKQWAKRNCDDNDDAGRFDEGFGRQNIKMTETRRIFWCRRSIHDVRGLISMQEGDGNVIGIGLKFLNIGDEDDANIYDPWSLTLPDAGFYDPCMYDT